MCIEQKELRLLDDHLHGLIEAANMMVSLVKAIDRQDGLVKKPIVKAVKVLVEDTLAKVMDQEHLLEFLLQVNKPEAYAEWLMSVSPEYEVFQHRVEQHETRRSCMAAF
jgi:hypothetical protein